MNDFDKPMRESKHEGETWYDEHGTLWRMGETVPITVTQANDPAQILLNDGFETAPIIHKRGCYICEDPEFARMGLPLCRKCPACGGHVAADDTVCDICGLDDQAFFSCPTIDKLVQCFSTGYPEYNIKVPSDIELACTVNAWLNREESTNVTT